MRRRLMTSMLCLMLLLFQNSAMAEFLPGPPVLRALLLACDDFVTQPDTTPSSYNNVTNVRRALLQDRRGYRAIKVAVNQALDAEGFLALAQEAFEGAKNDDISLIYLSTHGLRGEGETADDFIALMSDGVQESHLKGQDIQRALQKIPGVKALILDACFSGAAIRKGLDQPYVSSPFTGPDFKVLSSAGGSEPSFLWTDGLGTVQGGSYFAEALVDGISRRGRFAADENRDGQITLHELHIYQLRSYGASTPQVYPEGDSFVLFAYDPAKGTDDIKAVTDVSFETRVIRDAGAPLFFSYTLNEPSYLAYQLIYQQEGAWRFTAPQSIAQEEEGKRFLKPGRKEAALTLQPGLNKLSGYLLLFIITVQEDRARPQTCVLLSVQNDTQDPQLRLDSAPLFSPAKGEEAAFILRHQGPTSMTARVKDEQEKTVSTLLYERPSRPTQLREEGTSIFWNGKTEVGELAPPGLYHLEVTAWIGTQRQTISGDDFVLQAP